MTGIKVAKKRAGACSAEVVPPSAWQKNRMTRQQRLYRAKLLPASAEMVERRPKDARWFALIVVDGAELTVDGRLSDAGVQTLVPREKVDVIRKEKGGKTKLVQIERACFQGYVFVHIVPSPLAFDRLREVRAVIDFLHAGESYHVVRDSDLGFYRGAAAKLNLERMPADKSIGDGDKVRVKLGPFAGIEGVVLQVIKPNGRSPEVRLWSTTYGKEIKNPLAFMEKL